MKKIYFLAFVLIAISSALCFSQCLNENAVLDDLEGPITGGADGTVDYGAGNGSSVSVSASADIKQSGSQSLKIEYNAVSGGYMWVAKGFELDAANAQWLIQPQDINWESFSAVSFYMYGSDSKALVAFDLKDNGNEMYRFYVNDDFSGWKKIDCEFSMFFARDDWQPDNADKNAQLDFPLKSFQFEPLPVSSGTIYIDKVELVK